MTDVFTPDGARLNVADLGEGPPVLFLHGFMADAQLNWAVPGILQQVQDRGYRIIAADARGHGGSDKPHDQDSYRQERRVADVVAVLNAKGIHSAPLVGYSMGAVTAYRTAYFHPQRVTALLCAGVGERMLRPSSREHNLLIAALQGQDMSDLRTNAERELCEWIDAIKPDREALLACAMSVRGDQRLPGPIETPTWVVTGDDDVVAGSPFPLAARLPNGEAHLIRGDHASALSGNALCTEVLEFLQRYAPTGQ